MKAVWLLPMLVALADLEGARAAPAPLGTPWEWQAHRGAVRAVAFSPDGKRLATGGADGALRLWDTASRKELARFWPPDEGIPDYCAFAPDGRSLAVAFVWQGLTLHMPSGVEVRPTKEAEEAYERAGRVLQLNSYNPWGALSSVWVLEERQGWKARRLTRDGPGPETLAFSPAGDVVLMADRNGVLWELGRDRPRRRFSLDWDSFLIRDISLSGDGRRLVLVGLGDLPPPPDGSDTPPASLPRRPRRKSCLLLRETASGKQVAVLPFPPCRDVDSARLAPDGRHLAVVGVDHSIWILDARTSDRWLVPTPFWGKPDTSGFAETVAFSADSQSLAIALPDRSVAVAKVSSGFVQRVCKGHRAAVGAVAFAPDGRRLVSGDEDGVIRLWDLGRQ